MKTFPLELTVEQIAQQINAKSLIVSDFKMNNVAELLEANEQSVCFFENNKYIIQLKSTSAGLIFFPEDFDKELKPSTNLIFVDKPYITFMMLVDTWMKLSYPHPGDFFAQSAVHGHNCKFGKEVYIGPNVCVGNNVSIGDKTIIEANTVIRDNCQIGSGCHFYPNITIYEDTKIGDNCIFHSGVVIGADGFGFLLHQGNQVKIPQVGNVVIEDNVEIGANSSVDRATIGSTVIGRGTKIDNLVQVGHNCKIGENSILCAQVGLAGSTVVGNVVYLAGQVGVAGHLTINNRAMIGAQSGVSNNVPEDAKIFGTPAIDAGLKKRIIAMEKYIPDVVKDYRKREKNKVKK